MVAPRHSFTGLATRSSSDDLKQACSTVLAQPGIAAALDAVPEWVLILDANRQIVFANQAVTRALHRPLSEMIGQRAGELLSCEVAITAPSGCGTGQACRTCGALHAILDAQSGFPSTQECRMNRHSRCGLESLDLRISCQPFPIASTPYVLLYARDIGADKRREVLEHIFFHDLLNLAGGIEGISTLLAEQAVPLDSVIDDLLVSARQLVSEIQSQRILTAAEAGTLSVHHLPLLAQDVLLKVRQTFRLHPVAAQRQIHVPPVPKDLAFVSDETLLARVLGNLLKNALEATPVGGQVTLNAYRASPDNDLVFTCHNSNPIPEPILLQIFQRSFSTKGTGRGLGTYSVKLLVERYLQGRVAVHSSPQDGTTFSVFLPANPSTTPLPANGCPADPFPIAFPASPQ